MTNYETQIAVMKTQIENIEGITARIEEMLQKHIDWCEEEREKLDTKYAPKSIATIVYWAAGVFGTAIIGALASLVIINPR